MSGDANVMGGPGSGPGLEPPPPPADLPEAPRSAPVESHHWYSYLLYAARRSPSLLFGGGIILVYTLAALVSLVWTPHEHQRTMVGPTLAPPSAEHWFGTDQLGMDVFSRTMAATLLDLRITVLAVVIALVCGVALGTISGYFSGKTDLVLLRLLEMVQSIPTLLLAMIVVVALGSGEINVVIVLAFLGLPYYARLVRAEILSKRNWPFAEAAKMVGNPPLRIAFRHLLPNSLGPVFAYASVNAAWVVLVAASLGYLGIGVEPNKAEWGAMISRGQTYMVTGEWWVAFFPGLAVFGLTAGFYLLGDGLRDVLDPRSRR